MASFQLDARHAPDVLPIIQPVLRRARFITAVTGAGISVASGLPVLNDDLHGTPLRQFFEPVLLQTNPSKYYELYREALSTWRQAQPNAAHLALAAMGAWVVTQNIDGLHRDAGSKHVIELHGNFRELVCRPCGRIFSSRLAFAADVPRCTQCRNVLEPGIVLRGQEVRHFSRAVDWVGRSELVFIVGTALQDAPARQLPGVAEANGATVVWVNEAAEDILPLFCQTPAQDG